MVNSTLNRTPELELDEWIAKAEEAAQKGNFIVGNYTSAIRRVCQELGMPLPTERFGTISSVGYERLVVPMLEEARNSHYYEARRVLETAQYWARDLFTEVPGEVGQDILLTTGRRLIDDSVTKAEESAQRGDYIAETFTYTIRNVCQELGIEVPIDRLQIVSEVGYRTLVEPLIAEARTLTERRLFYDAREKLRAAQYHAEELFTEIPDNVRVPIERTIKEGIKKQEQTYYTAERDNPVQRFLRYFKQ